MTGTTVDARCPVCGVGAATERYRMPESGTEMGVSADAFRPSAERFGTATGTIVRCVGCGHMFVADPPAPEAVTAAYADAADAVSLREEPGQVATAARDLALIERHVSPGRVCDLGCWTGSFLAAARARGWEASGVEPSRWAAERAAARGLDVRVAELDDHGLEPGSCRLVVMTDVLEHLADPGAGVDVAAGLLEPEGALWITVPDAGSRLARVMGRRWWSVLPMHLQYFDRDSLTRLLRGRGFTPVWTGSHAKIFSTRYYAERLGGYRPWLERSAVAAVTRLGLAERPFAPDFRDRLAVLARRTAP